MKTKNTQILCGIVLSLIVGLAWSESQADPVPPGYTIIDIAGYNVPVITGGLYDRYRSNPPLSVIAAEAPDVDLTWFSHIEKQLVDIGFESYSPNFYYKNSKISAIFTADLDRLRELMPPELLEHVKPISPFPNRGLVQLTAYAYHYCDNDYYNELSLSIATTKPGEKTIGLISLLNQMGSNDYWGYVLKLPVNTELARVRGVVGYNLPKWLTEITYNDTGTSIIFQIFDSETGNVDLTFEGKKLDDLSSDATMVKTSFTNMDHSGALIYGYTDFRHLSSASCMKSSSVDLTLNGGSLSHFIESLDLGMMMRYEYVPEFQGALYSPQPLESLLID